MRWCRSVPSKISWRSSGPTSSMRSWPCPTRSAASSSCSSPNVPDANRAALATAAREAGLAEIFVPRTIVPVPKGPDPRHRQDRLRDGGSPRLAAGEGFLDGLISERRLPGRARRMRGVPMDPHRGQTIEVSLAAPKDRPEIYAIRHQVTRANWDSIL